MVSKIDTILVKTVQGRSIDAAKAMVAFCPSSLQTAKMMPTAAVRAAIPLINAQEWERYITMPTQQPPPSTTAGPVHWWKSRLADFPSLAPVAIAYLLSPRSAAQAERTFSRLGHIQTDDRLNMCNQTLQGLTFIYLNKQLFAIKAVA